MSAIALDTPLAEALSTAVHAKIVEEGWTQDDDTSLAEYIVLMLANGKTQEQIAAELAGELLQDAKGTTEFSQWLFEQVNALSQGGNDGSAQQMNDQSSAQTQDQYAESGDMGSDIPAAYDADMGDNAPDNAPKGPRGLHGGRSGRGRGGGAGKADSVLHRTRGNDRINSHTRGAPKGPRGGQNMRPGMQKALNGLNVAGSAQSMANPMMQNGNQPGQPMMAMSPQQQIEFMAMMEQQARMMAQFMPGMVPQGNNSGFPPNGTQSRSLFDRVEPSRGRGGSRGRGRGNAQQNGASRNSSKVETESTTGGESQAGESMDVDVGDSAQQQQQQQEQQQKPSDPFSVMCHFNLRCTNKDCTYAHQSPASHSGITVDLTQTCQFGPACKNSFCTARHPSPAQVRAHHASELCKFFPNCQNPICPFKHPDMPLCSFGAACRNKDCKFTHLQTPCRFNPCLNTKCIYKHEPGQHKSMADFQWTADGAKKKEEDEKREHVSDRKFVADDAEEELIRPEANGNGTAGANDTPVVDASAMVESG